MLCGARRARHAGAVPSTDPPLDPPRLDVPMGATGGASVKLRTISMMMLLRTPSSSALQLTSSTVAPRLGSTMALSSSAATKGTRMAGGVAENKAAYKPFWDKTNLRWIFAIACDPGRPGPGCRLGPS